MNEFTKFGSAWDVTIPESGCDLSDVHLYQPIETFEGMLCKIPVIELEKLASLRIRHLSLIQVELPEEAYSIIPEVVGLEELCISPSAPGEIALSYLAKCRELQMLALSDSGINDSAVAHLARLDTLRKLDLSATRVTCLPETFQDLKHLSELILGDTAVGDETVSILANCPSLKYLSLTNTRVTDEGVSTICEEMELSTLFLGGPGVTDRSLERLVGMTTLRSLIIVGTSITKTSTATLCRMSNLEFLMLPKRLFGWYRRMKLESALPNCQVFWDND